MRVLWIAALGIAGCFDPPEFTCEADAECVRDGIDGRCELVGYCSFLDDSCDTGRRFADVSSAFSNTCLPIASACLLPNDAIEAWRLDIPSEPAGYTNQADVSYALDERAALGGTPFTRVAYCLLLDDIFIYTELDDFTAGDIGDTGVPTNKIFDIPISNLTVRTNSNAVTPVAGAAGTIELWPNCYGPGPNGVFDFDDDLSGTTPTSCYGSFQVHAAASVLWAFNKWTRDDEVSDLGIGNSPTGNPDYTFEDNVGDYTVRTLQAFLIP